MWTTATALIQAKLEVQKQGTVLHTVDTESGTKSATIEFSKNCDMKGCVMRYNIERPCPHGVEFGPASLL